MSKLAKRLEGHFAACAAAAALGVTPSADASIIYSGPVNINIPSTTAGVYLNVVTGVFSTTPASAVGWDVNPWGTGTALNMFSQTGGGHVTTGSATTYDNVPIGTWVSAASTFSNLSTATINPATPLNFNSSNNHVGFRFLNEFTGLTHYGWMRISLSATGAGQPRAIVEYSWDDTPGAPIFVGLLPAPCPLVTGLIAGCMAHRRRRG